MSESGRIDGEGSLQDLSVERLREDYLVGVDQYLLVDGKPVEDKWYERWIARATAHVEKEAQISIRTREWKREPHDFNAADYWNFSFLQLFNRPIFSDNIQVDAVYPTGTLLMSFPQEWIRPDTNAAQIQIVPTMGSLSQVLLGRGGAYLPLLFNTLQYLPQFFQVSYRSGFAAGHVPEDVIEAVMKRAAIDIMAVAGDLVYGPGVTNISQSMDGLSESRGIVNNAQLGAVFTSRISQYRKDLYGEGQTYGGTGQIGLIKRIKQYYYGIQVVSL